MENNQEELYYLQDTRGTVGNCASWRAKDCKGYTTNLEQAHKFTLFEAISQMQSRHTDLAWSCNKINNLTHPVVDVQFLNLSKGGGNSTSG